MLNNAELLDPYGPGAPADRLRDLRSARGLTALDEGQAWRRREGGVLLVVRVEAFASADDVEHRAGWRADGPRCLEETWRERWRDREVEPGWIEARLVDPVDDRIDWVRVEDHTGQGRDVVVYQHLTVWAGRMVVVLTLRHELGLDVDAELTTAARLVADRAGGGITRG